MNCRPPTQQQSTAIPNQLTSTVQELSTSLQTIAPQNSETAQLITYTLIAAAMVGIFVYHYIKNQENI
ncbi:MAG: hypothetical protein NY202_00405 [Mollicutes bacterium UO1]